MSKISRKVNSSDIRVRRGIKFSKTHAVFSFSKKINQALILQL